MSQSAKGAPIEGTRQESGEEVLRAAFSADESEAVRAEPAPSVETSRESSDDSAPTGGNISAAAGEAGEQERQRALEIVEQAERLPPWVRARLKDGIAAGKESSLQAVISAVEEALLDVVSPSAPAGRPEHPAGEAFFSGAAGELSDSEAEAFAQQQLQRAGLLRGQRVRVAD